MERTDQEIEDQINWAQESIETGTSRYSAMTYEEGVRAALDWITGFTDDKPDGEE